MLSSLLPTETWSALLTGDEIRIPSLKDFVQVPNLSRVTIATLATAAENGNVDKLESLGYSHQDALNACSGGEAWLHAAVLLKMVPYVAVYSCSPQSVGLLLEIGTLPNSELHSELHESPSGLPLVLWKQDRKPASDAQASSTDSALVACSDSDLDDDEIRAAKKASLESFPTAESESGCHYVFVAPPQPSFIRIQKYFQMRVEEWTKVMQGKCSPVEVPACWIKELKRFFEEISSTSSVNSALQNDSITQDDKDRLKHVLNFHDCFVVVF